MGSLSWRWVLSRWELLDQFSELGFERQDVLDGDSLRRVSVAGADGMEH
jgi:hypothetical protein